MRGSITKRGDSWFIRFDIGIDPVTGKRQQQAVSFKGTKKQAEAKLSEFFNQLDKGVYAQPKKMTLAEYLEQWLKDYCWQYLSPMSAEAYQRIARKHIIPAIGKMKLSELKPQHLQPLYTEKLNEGLSARTVIYIHTTIHKSLSAALKTGLVSRNVADAVEVPKLEQKEMKTMSESDIERFLELTRSTEYYALFYTLLTTGLRRGEALGLQWNDVDLLGAEIAVKRTLQQLDDGQIIVRQPKTEKSRRTIAIPPSAALVLGQLKEEERQKRLVLEQPFSESDYVFCHDDKSPYLPASVTHAFKRLARECGLEDIHLHSARHTMATLMLKLDIHPLIVSRMLGHSNIQTTLNVYSHVSPGIQAAAARLDELMPKSHEAKKESEKITP